MLDGDYYFNDEDYEDIDLDNPYIDNTDPEIVNPVVDDEWVNPNDPGEDPYDPPIIGDVTVRNPDGSITNGDGSTTYTDPDDGSTITVDRNGNPISATTSIATGSLPATERDPATGQIRVTTAGKENPGGWLQSLQKFTGIKDSKDVTGFLKNVLTTKDDKGNVGVSPIAPAIGAIIGMLNRTKGDEGTRGLKDAPTPYVANRQQITQPIGAATGQGQQYFSPTTYTKTPEPQNLPVRTTGGGIEGLRPQPTPTGFPLGYDPNAPQPPRPAPWEVLYDIPPQEPKPDQPQIGPQPDYSPLIGPKPEPAPPQEFEMAMGPNGPVKMPKLPPGMAYAEGGLAGIPMQDPVSMYAYGGLSDLGGYTHAAGGRMLKGPGDGMSDSIPASIAGKQPARLATDEFVIPADVVSHLGNGSSDAGAKVLYDMMARVRKARTGKAMQGKKINPQKLMPR
jgi:hypothetical protein